LKNFLDKIFNLDITIIGHNIKYDLEIIELFKRNLRIDKFENKLENKLENN